MENKSVFILNYAAHYRQFIFKKINDELNADFYFGDIANSSVKKMDYSELSNFKKELKTIKVGPFLWYRGSVGLVLKPYKNIILTGDPMIVSNWFILILGIFLRKKIFLWTHGWYGREAGIRSFIKLLYFKLANTLLVYGEYSQKLLLEKGFKKDNVVVIYNSLDYENQTLIKKDLYKTNVFKDKFNNNDPVLFYIGRIQKSKKLDLILDAMLQLSLRGIATNLVIVGAKEESYDFEKEISQRKLQQSVWLVGPVYKEIEIAHYIYNADVCVSPGNIGLTALHSLIYETPVVTHSNFSKQMPEFETVVDGVNGAFFKEDDLNDLVKTIEKVLLIKNSSEKDFSDIIHEKWNPKNQIDILKKIII